MENENKKEVIKKETNKKDPGYITGLVIARIIWVIIIMCILALGIALVASVSKLLIWYLSLLFY